MDAGRKALNIEIYRPQVLGKPGVTVDAMSAEHGVLKLTPDAADVRIGELIETAHVNWIKIWRCSRRP
jgi:D-serine deaminase-like pyridoxal phosphate-dependent protein